ncbi:MAG: hypothetical protein JWM71_639 [Solirubrobacteraceae bacterium]|nr:hypothetical protein [Solirubrobacteraceae bacterium]
MRARTTSVVSSTEARTRLDVLLEERAAALRTALAANPIYMSDLEAEIATCRAAYVASSVTELALLRGALHGRPQG